MAKFKYMASMVMLGTFLCDPAAAAQMTLGDLYKLCTSANEGDKTACTFYILGVFEGAALAGATVQDKTRTATTFKKRKLNASVCPKVSPVRLWN